MIHVRQSSFKRFQRFLSDLLDKPHNENIGKILTEYYCQCMKEHVKMEL